MPNLVRGMAVAAAAACVFALGAAPASARRSGAPKAEVKPSVPTYAEDGRVLTVNEGKWRSTSPVTYSYEWQRCGGASGCAAIAGAEAQSYRVQTEDIGHQLRVIVTATNESGSKASKTNKTGKVAPGSPLNLELPTISGTVLPGQTLTADPGTWVGTPPITFRYEWLNCEPLGGLCHEISGASEQTYTIQPTEAGDGYAVIVRGVNPYGESPARSPEVKPEA